MLSDGSPEYPGEPISRPRETTTTLPITLLNYPLKFQGYIVYSNQAIMAVGVWER